jgi:hypothetical protein
MVSCTDSNMISTNAILPDPPSITWPPGYGGRPVGGASLDPNDIIGPEGHGAQGWIRESLNLPYIIRFENMATSTNESGVIVTNWPAQEVIITNRLDAAFDLATFQLGTFGFGTNTYTIPAGLQAFSTNINRETDLGFNVTLDARLDIPEGMVTWHFQSVDPITRRLISDPIAGFLPPNTNPPCGEGFVSYAIGLATNLSQGTTIEAEAGIVFDVNEPIITPRITNTLDNIAPTSTVLALPERARKPFHVTWTGSDTGSGVAYYDIYISTNGVQFSLWQSQATNTWARYSGSLRQTNYFYAVATDNVGNREAKTPAPEAWTLVRPGALPWLLIVLER